MGILNGPASPMAANRFVPGALSWFANPLSLGQRTAVLTTGKLYLHPFYSGDESITIDKLDIVVNTIGSAGAVHRPGIYIVSDQKHPFKYTIGSKWADLLVDGAASAGAALVTDSGTGQKILTLATAVVIPPYTWFAVGGADQVATAATRYMSISAPNGSASPFGAESTSGTYNTGAVNALAMTGVTGALPQLFVPTSAEHLDSGVGLHRSV